MAAILRILVSLVSMKSLMGTIVTVVVGIVFYNLACELLQESLNFGLAKLNTVTGQIEMPENGSITGFAAWFLSNLRIVECISFITMAISIKWMLRKIPFLRW